MQEDNKLKRLLILQSFCPLFLLVFIQHVGHFSFVYRFFVGVYHRDFSVLVDAINGSAIGDVIITFFCIIWFIITAVVAFGFRSIQEFSFDHYGETIVVKSEKKDSGVSFLVSFILPLLVEDVSTFRGFIFFIALLTMVIFLLVRSDLFYQNPVLVALKYKTYEFQFVTSYTDVKKDRTYIGLSKGEIPSEKAAIKRKYIADNVFIVYNE